ncbi:MAG: hypothetical protein CEN91_503 [Candidatus Berkelbacteria bacterium Licking1014_85]|uniref:G5 domain-containing protein n=1 Tax=Candidatus Berkelbacteria bacterium Licking1014_85 TaxID=2017148 RepID=A0A554LHE5_9BACT|nr:MAG: hypothetical protein CEN91_503 [Candidatus Berkelbacteria bacterium Licking1014_85]
MVLGVVAMLSLILGSFNIVFASRVYPNIYVGKIPLGGLTLPELSQTISDITANLKNRPIILKIDDSEKIIKSENIELNFDTNQTIHNIFAYGRNKNILTSIYEQTQLLIKSKKIPAIYLMNSAKFDIEINQIADEINQNFSDATLKFENNKLVEIPEKIGKKLDIILLKNSITNSLETLSQNIISYKTDIQDPMVYTDGLSQAKAETEKLISQPIIVRSENNTQTFERKDIFNWISFSASKTSVSNGRGFMLATNISQDKIINDLKIMAKKIDQPAINAKLTIENGKATVFQKSAEGKEVDLEASARNIVKALEKDTERIAEIVIKVTQSEIGDDAIEKLGIKELIGTAETSFAKSPANRISNLETGAKYLNGQLIKPDEQLSAVKALGSISTENGYLPELVIKDNRTIPEIGGGLCQVSTTLFRAALNAGLPIIERTNHSFRVSYYEPPVGLDATIYIPKPDLVIKNDTPGWILLQSSVDRTTNKIKFEFYGTSDGRRAEIKGPYLSNYINPPDPINEDDPTLPEGQTKQVEKPHQGVSSVAYYKVYNADGAVRTDQTFKSKYKALPAVFKVGKKPTQ